ncbi:MAG: acetoacetyl-CoA synthetase, partial [Solirubrobacteraceae bacterium]|nr:acetoacetyl-CoA synthetase [Solirubrobacteraceae bacterium]
MAESQLTSFMRFCEASTGIRFAEQAAFHQFSIAEYRRFWHLFLRWSGMVHEGSPEPVCTDDLCERASFFPELRLNYVENLLRIDSPESASRLALVAHHPARPPLRLTRGELRDRVRNVAAGLRRLGVAPGDRVVAVAGNNAEVVVGGLAAAAVGATFSSASPEMGAPAVLSRFEQLKPTVLMANLAAGEAASTALSERVGEIARGLPSLSAVIALDDGPLPQRLPAPVHAFSDLMTRAAGASLESEWERFPFNHPLFVLFTSGTTGRPKCIVHGAGGTLLEHLKEHRLHVDLTVQDRLFFHTSAAWMMWNWQLSALATGSAIVLRDGPLTGPETLWRLVSAEQVTVFGTSPPYLQLCQDSGFSPRRDAALPHLRAVLSTGSILHDSQYDWFRDHVAEVPLQSISGGTDIIGCFVLGNPNLPVRRGRIQCRSLGLDVQALPTDATAPGSAVGELVCRNPFPSRPIGFVGDDGGQLHEAYFQQNPGVWTHGDLIEFDASGQARMHGRSDEVLNVHGIRIGPAEIYGALHDVVEVREAMAIQQEIPDERGQSRLVLLVVLQDGAAIDGRLAVRVRREIARCASPAHVPDLLVAVDELPRTHSGKRSERAARDAVNELPVRNHEALSNPGSLDEIRRAVALAAEQRRELSGAAEPGRDASTEARVRAIWESVLGVAQLRADDEFFDVGGTSLAAVRIFQLIHDRLGVDLPVSTLLRASTTAALAAVIDGPAAERFPSLQPLRPGTGGSPLFVVHALHGDVLFFRPLALRMSTDRPVYGLQARGLDPREQPQTRIEDMAETYVETIRSVQPHGPYALAGYSFGGLVAFEMARRLSVLGEDVDMLELIEARVHHNCLPTHLRRRFLAGLPFRVLRTALFGPRSHPPQYLRKAVLRVAPWAPIAPPAPVWGPLPPRLGELEPISWQAFNAYRPGP